MNRELAVFGTLLLAIGCFLLWRLYYTQRRTTSKSVSTDREKAPVTDAYNDIEPLRSFDWSTTEPIQVRVFKPKFFMTMGAYLLKVENEQQANSAKST